MPRPSQVVAVPSTRDLAAAKDWAETPLGPADTWPAGLRTMVATCLGARVAAVVFWGPEFVQIYNDAYAPLIGAKHPEAFGQRSQAVLPEIWHVIGPMLGSVLETGVATWEQNQQLFLDRAGFAEECYFTYTFSPIGADPIEGVFCVALETTTQVIGDRRAALLRELSASLAGLPTAGAVFDRTVAILRSHPDDLVAGCLRVAGEDTAPPRSWGMIADAQRLADAGAAAELRVAAGTTAIQRLGSALVAQPIAGLGTLGPAAMLVLDVNPHIPFDLAYEEFIGRIGAIVGAAYAVADGFEVAARRAVALEELDAAKTAFLSNISHEFRTPLTLLLGPLAAAREDPRLPADLRDGLGMAERNGRRVLQLVNRLLDISRLEAGRVAATYQPTDLAAVTADLASIFRGAAESAGIAWVVDCPPLDEPVHVDREMWEQIVTNLCANALKFTRSGTVTVRLSRAGDEARLSVADTGIGIVAADVPLIFDRFRRVGTAEAAAQTGSGLGLALVRELVDRHGGRTEVESVLGRGSTFRVGLPFGTGHLDPASVTADLTPPPRALSGSPADLVPDLPVRRDDAAVPVHDLATATIWIVDDDADMREYLRNLLRAQWGTVTFASAEPVLDALTRTVPDLILSDVTLPGASGLDLLAAVRRHPPTAGTPVILLSARAGEEATLEGLRAGADDYMVKPFTARELISRVRSNLHLAGVRREVGARTLRHGLQLEALARVATRMMAAGTLPDISRAIEDFVRDMTPADGCVVSLDSPGTPAAGLTERGGRLAMTSGGVIDVTVGPDAELDAEDIRLIEQLAVIAEHRSESVRRFRIEHSTSHTLQRSLLPDALPCHPRIEMVARYRPALEASDVGGDWYDALVLPDGRIMVTVGDVMGHDLGAAVTMSQIRLLLRARAADASGPAELCATVNRLLPVVGAPKLATMVVAFIDPESGQVTLVNAGHPLPILRTPDRTASVDVPAAMPLGVVADGHYQDFGFTLAPDAMLLLYTDGLVERRDEHPAMSRDNLLRRVAGLDVTDLGTAIDVLLDGGAGPAGDDIALLALRRRA